MKNKIYTWVIKNEEGQIINRTSWNTNEETKAIYYGKLEDVIKLITYKEWKEMATLEIYNNSYDKINHKPITKERLEKMLEEMR